MTKRAGGTETASTTVPLRPAFVVHSLEHVEAALAAAPEGAPALVLVSAQGAGASLGPLFWQAILRQASEAYPNARFTAYLDCADEAGTVLRALRAGVRHVRFFGRPEVSERLAAISEQLGAEITDEAFDTFDLLDQPDSFAACRAWLWRKNTLCGQD